MVRRLVQGRTKGKSEVSKLNVRSWSRTQIPKSYNREQESSSKEAGRQGPMKFRNFGEKCGQKAFQRGHEQGFEVPEGLELSENGPSLFFF